MENIVFTQLSIPEVRRLFREEVINVMSNLPEDVKKKVLNQDVSELDPHKKRTTKNKEGVNNGK